MNAPWLGCGGGLIERASSLFNESHAAAMSSSTFRWAAIQVYTVDDAGTISPVDNNAELGSSSWRRPFEAQGVKILGWGSNGTEPAREAALAAAAIDQFSLAGWIANPEKWHKGDEAGGDPARSARFVSEFRRRQPTTQLAFSTLGAASPPWVLGRTTDRAAGPMDFKAWFDAGADLIAQAYFNESELYRPDLCVAHALRAGWPLQRLVLLLGIYVGQRGFLRGLDYAPLLRGLSVGGIGAYLLERMVGEDYAALAPAAASAAARVAPPPPPVTANTHRLEMIAAADRGIALMRANGISPSSIASTRIARARAVLLSTQSPPPTARS